MVDNQSHVETKVGSERSFGLIFAAMFAVFSIWPLLDGGTGPRTGAGLIAAAFMGLALFAPRVLRPANVLWARFGIYLGRIVAPIVMALMFFIAVTPTAFIMRAMSKQPLRLRLDPNAESYWIHRDTAAQSSMRNQF